MRLRTFKETFCEKVDLRKISAVCQGDWEIAKSPVVSSLREVSDDIEKRNRDTHPVKTKNKSPIYKCSKMSVSSSDDLGLLFGFSPLISHNVVITISLISACLWKMVVDLTALNWTTVNLSGRRVGDGKKTIQTIRDCHEATPDRCSVRAMSVSYWRYWPGPDYGTNVLSLEQAVRRHGDASTQGVVAAAEDEPETLQGCFQSHTG